MVRIRITICVQLGCLVSLATSIGLTVIALATWYTNHRFVKDVRSDALMLSASLKSAQVSSTLLLMQTLARQAALRRSPQTALESYYKNDNADDQWDRTAEDYDAMFAGSEYNRIAVQARIYHKEGFDRVLFSQTADSMMNLSLPYQKPGGKPAIMGDVSYGYIPELYPPFIVRAINRTSDHYEAEYQGRAITGASPLLSGPYRVGDRLTLVSITMPIVNNTSSGQVMGWLTVALDARLINDIIESREGLGQGGVSLLVGPYNVTNKFPTGYLFDTPDSGYPTRFEIQYQLSTKDVGGAHRGFHFGTAPPFDWDDYPTIRTGFTSATGKRNNVGSALSTRNENQHGVSVGCAIVNSSMVDWMVVVERPHAEIWAPIKRLRRVILTCVFGTLAGMLIITFPAAHYLSRPVRRLRDATQTSVLPQSIEADPLNDQGAAEYDISDGALSLTGILTGRNNWYQKLYLRKYEPDTKAPVRRQFMIPSKVKDNRHFIHDELTELTRTFNQMVGELMTRYERLEARVRQRTAELELSKEAAEAANKSKTLFIANISHELKTPLNGIMGMLAVCMSEDNSPRLKESLETIYKSGDLLSNLLTDLLTFRETQMGQHSSLDEKEFRLSDIGSQVLAIFGQQAEEGGNTLSVRFEGSHGQTTVEDFQDTKSGTALCTESDSLKDMALFGDEHLILRVILNLVSNSLKFTPEGGSVIVTIRCMGELDLSDMGRDSALSHHSSMLRAPSRIAVWGEATQSTAPRTLSADAPSSSTPFHLTSKSSHSTAQHSAPNASAEKWLSFEFEVQDTGLGIPKYLHDRIFEPFVQGDVGLSKKYSGAGLGLSICARLAGMLKGRMRMKSQVGRGSVFVMSIPLRCVIGYTGNTDHSPFQPSIAAPQRARIAGPPSITDLMQRHPSTFGSPLETDGPRDDPPTIVASEDSRSHHSVVNTGSSSPILLQISAAAKILVAEDNRTNQEVITRMLKLEGFNDVVVAADGREAVNKLKERMDQPNMFDLVFMDVQMPNLDGLQATRLIRQSGFRGPIVALTAYTDPTNMEECLKAGMNAFLAKPVRRPALKDVLKKYMLPSDKHGAR